MENIFKKESHYFYVATIIVCGYVYFMNYLFNASWAGSEAALGLIGMMEIVVPSIRQLHDNAAEYTNYWGIFFSIFWLTSPIYWLLGFLGASKLSLERHRKLVLETTIFRVVCVFLMAVFCFGFLFAFPIFGGMYYVRQTSHFFPVLALSWWAVMGVIYFRAQIFRVLIIKLSIN